MKIADNLNRLTIFAKKGPSQMFSRIPNAPPIVGVVNMACRWIGSTGICNRSLVYMELVEARLWLLKCSKTKLKKIYF